MKKQRRLLTALLTGAMALSLAGCGMSGSKTPDPAELAARVGDLDLTGYYAASISFTGSANDGEASGKISFDANVETDGTVTHIDGLQMTFAMEGLTMAVGGEGWTDMASRTSYMNMSMLGEETRWTSGPIEDTDDGMSEMLDGMAGLTQPGGVEPVLEEHEKGEPWEVSWEVDANSMSGILDGLSDIGAGDALDGGVDTVVVTASFDESSYDVRSIHVKAAGESVDIFAHIEFESVGGDTKLSVPEDVISAALENGSLNDVPDITGSIASGDDEYSFGMSMCEDGYMTDNDGYDAVIDGMAKEAAARTDGRRVSVIHYPDYAEMTVRYDGDDWSGEISVKDMSNSAYSDALEEFTNEIEFLDDWYDAGERVESDGNYAMYLQPDEMDACYVSGTMVVSVSAYTYEDMPREAFDGYIAELVQLAGAPERER